jgi:hypothetical protein
MSNKTYSRGDTMIDFQIIDLDEVNVLIEELRAALAELSGKICEIHFDPSKPEEVQAAVEQTERAVDDKLSGFPDNPLVQQFAAGIKRKFKGEIVKRATEARKQLEARGIPFDPVKSSAMFGGTVSKPLDGWSSAYSTKRRL